MCYWTRTPLTLPDFIVSRESLFSFLSSPLFSFLVLVLFFFFWFVVEGRDSTQLFKTGVVYTPQSSRTKKTYTYKHKCSRDCAICLNADGVGRWWTMVIMAIIGMVVLYCIILLHGTKGIRYSAKQSKDGAGCKCAALRISGCLCGCQHPRFHQKMCVCTFMLCCADRFL